MELSRDRTSSNTVWPMEAPAYDLLETPPRLRVPLSMVPAPLPDGLPPHDAKVRRGERLGPAHSIAPLAPTSGRVVGHSQVELLNGHTVPAIDIEADFEDAPRADEHHDAPHAREQHEQLLELEHAEPRDLARWIDRLRDGGVWADRPGSPDLMQQLHLALRQPVDTILCNLLDDEPTLRLNSMLAARFPSLLLAGVNLLAKLTGAKRIRHAVEAGSPGRWWTVLRRLARKARHELVAVINDYPQADATLLARQIADRRLKPGRCPVEQRLLILDAAAAIAIGRLADRGQPMLQVPVAIRDHFRHESHFVIVPVGVPVRQVLEQRELPTHNALIRRGAVLRANAVSLEAVIAGGELTLHVTPPHAFVPPDPCTRCLWCVENCPTGVEPAGVLEAAQREDEQMARQFGIDQCIECGVCSYMCPSRLPLLEGIRTLLPSRRQTPLA